MARSEREQTTFSWDILRLNSYSLAPVTQMKLTEILTSQPHELSTVEVNSQLVITSCELDANACGVARLFSV